MQLLCAVWNAVRVFQFADRVGVVRSVVQRIALISCERKRVVAIKRNTHHQIKVLRMEELGRPVDMKKLNS